MVGEVIAEGPPEWMDCSFSEEELWEYVSQATSHRMNGRQLQGLHRAVHRQEVGRQDADAQRALGQSQEVVAASRSSLQTVLGRLPLRGRGLVKGDMQQLLQRFPLGRMVTAEGATACAAELESMAGRGVSHSGIQRMLPTVAATLRSHVAMTEQSMQIRRANAKAAKVALEHFNRNIGLGSKKYRGLQEEHRSDVGVSGAPGHQQQAGSSRAAVLASTSDSGG
jgi:hypothetical protein